LQPYPSVAPFKVSLGVASKSWALLNYPTVIDNLPYYVVVQVLMTRVKAKTENTSQNRVYILGKHLAWFRLLYFKDHMIQLTLEQI
jgi:hypothetical protein